MACDCCNDCWGCASYVAFWGDTCGENIVSEEIPWTRLGWGRRLDDTSDAFVELADIGRANPSRRRAACDEGCCASLNGIRPWCNTLMIFRRDKNGGMTKVWVGPVINIRLNDSDGFGGVIEAKDFSAYWSKRFIHNDHFFGEYPDIDLDVPAVDDYADIFEAIVLDGMTPNDACLNLVGGPIEKYTKRSYEANDHNILMDAVQSLSQGDFDWTVIGNTVYYGSVLEDPPFICDITLTDEDFINVPTINVDGLAEANSVYVEGQSDSEFDFTDEFGLNPIFGEAIGDQDCVLLEKFVQDSDINDAVSAQDAAEEQLNRYNGPVVDIEAGILAPEAGVIANMFPPVGCDEAPLIFPGAPANVSLNRSCWEVNGEYEIFGLDVTVSVDDDSGLQEESTVRLRRPDTN